MRTGDQIELTAVGVILVMAGALILAADCSPAPQTIPPQEIPDINASRILHVRPEHRVANYAGGSCVFATAATQLNYLDRPQAAKWMRSRYAGGEYRERLNFKMQLAGLDFSSSGEHDFGFIQRALRNRLPVGVNYPKGKMVFGRWQSGHVQLVVGYAAGELHMIDNNRPGRIHKVTYARFIQSWGGWAWTIVQAPPPPF